MFDIGRLYSHERNGIFSAALPEIALDMQSPSAIAFIRDMPSLEQRALFLQLVLRLQVDVAGGRTTSEVEIAHFGSVPFRTLVSHPAELAGMVKTLYSARAAAMTIEVVLCSLGDDESDGLGLMLLVDGTPAFKLGETSAGALFMRQLVSSRETLPRAEPRVYQGRPVEGWSR